MLIVIDKHDGQGDTYMGRESACMQHEDMTSCIGNENAKRYTSYIPMSSFVSIPSSQSYHKIYACHHHVMDRLTYMYVYVKREREREVFIDISYVCRHACTC